MRFQPGQSGNPSGRSKSYFALRDLAQVHTKDALACLAGIMANEKAPAAARVSAASAILDRGWGRPMQAISGPEGESPQVITICWKTAEEAKFDK